MNILERLKFFYENYDLISSQSASRGKRIIIGSRNSKICRFCHQGEESTTFKNVSHAIPEFLGNHQLILANECDNCNKFFSEKLENHLNKLLKPYIITARIPGKKGKPNYRSHNKLNRIEQNNGFNITCKDNSDFYNINENNKKLTLNLQVEKFIPIAVYKALVKISLSCLEDETILKDFQGAIRWILTEDHTKLFIKPAKIQFSCVSETHAIDKVTLLFFKRKPKIENVPYSIAILAFRNIVIQFIVPSGLEKNVKYRIPLYPLLFKSKPEYQIIDLSSSEATNKNIAQIVFSFKEKETK